MDAEPLFNHAQIALPNRPQEVQSIGSTSTASRSASVQQQHGQSTVVRPTWNSSTRPLVSKNRLGSVNSTIQVAVPVPNTPRKQGVNGTPSTTLNLSTVLLQKPTFSAANAARLNACMSSTSPSIRRQSQSSEESRKSLSSTTRTQPVMANLITPKKTSMIPPSAERVTSGQHARLSSLRPSQSLIASSPVSSVALPQSSNSTPALDAETITAIMAGITSKGVGKHDLQDHYEHILSSKNTSEKAMRATLRTLRHLVLTQGVPNSNTGTVQSLRHRIWKLLLGVYKVSADDYVALLGKGPSPVFDKVKNDAFRTLMGDTSFGKIVDEGMLIRVLNAFAWRAKDYPTSRLINLQFSYVQGMNVLAAPFLYVMPELDAFYTFATFIHHTCPLYVQPALEGVHCGIKLLDKCLMIADPQLHLFLKSKNMDPVMYAFPSVMTFSGCTPPLNEVLKLWDFLLSYGVHMNIICIVGQLMIIRSEILKSSSPMKILRTFPKLDAKRVIAMAVRVLEMIPDSLYDMLVRHVFDAMVCDGILNDE